MGMIEPVPEREVWVKASRFAKGQETASGLPPESRGGFVRIVDLTKEQMAARQRQRLLSAVAALMGALGLLALTVVLMSFAWDAEIFQFIQWKLFAIFSAILCICSALIGMDLLKDRRGEKRIWLKVNASEEAVSTDG